MKRAAAIVLLTVLATSGCFTFPATVSPSTKPLTKGKYSVVGEAEGRCYGVSIVGIPITDTRLSMIARDRAIESSSADALIGVTGDHTILDFGLVSVYWTTIQGSAVKIAKE